MSVEQQAPTPEDALPQEAAKLFSRQELFDPFRRLLQSEEGGIHRDRAFESAGELGVVIALVAAGTRASKVEMTTYITKSEQRMNNWQALEQVQSEIRSLLQPLTTTVDALAILKRKWRDQFRTENCDKKGENCITTWDEPSSARGFHSTLDTIIEDLSTFQSRLTRLVDTGAEAFDLQKGEAGLFQQSENSNVSAVAYIPIGAAFIFYEQVIKYLQENGSLNQGYEGPLANHYIRRRTLMKVISAGVGFLGITYAMKGLQRKNAEALGSLQQKISSIIKTIPTSDEQIFERYFSTNVVGLQRTMTDLSTALTMATQLENRKILGFEKPALNNDNKLAVQNSLSTLPDLNSSLNAFFHAEQPAAWAPTAEQLKLVNAVWATDSIASATNSVNMGTTLSNWAIPGLTGLGLGFIATVSELYLFPWLDKIADNL